MTQGFQESGPAAGGETLVCPLCGAQYPSDTRRCANDGSMLATSKDPLIGNELDGRFRIIRLLGEGGMGKVYEGTQISVDRRVAIKLLHKEISSNANIRERFFREAKLISGFTHPNVVRLIDFGETGEGMLFLAMEYVDGVPLSELTKRGKLRLPLALEVITQMCGALTEAHAQGVVHRDLKPENIYLVRNFDDSLQVKVLDFGVAHADGGAEALTMRGMVLGTPEYMAPELAQGLPATPGIDVYAIGAMLYEFVAGSAPYVMKNPVQTMMAHIDQPVPDPQAKTPECPAELQQLIMRLLAKDVADRPSDSRGVRDEVRSVRKALGIESVRELASGNLYFAFDAWVCKPGELVTSPPRTEVPQGPAPSPVRTAQENLQSATIADAPSPVANRAQAPAQIASTGAPGGAASVATPQSDSRKKLLVFASAAAAIFIVIFFILILSLAGGGDDATSGDGVEGGTEQPVEVAPPGEPGATGGA